MSPMERPVGHAVTHFIASCTVGGGGLCPRAIIAKAFEEVFSSLFPIVILEVIDDTHEENLFPRDRLSAVILTQRRPALAPHDTR
jgi:hypothetical protein